MEKPAQVTAIKFSNKSAQLDWYGGQRPNETSDRFQPAFNASSRVISLFGPAGVGKTSFVQDLERRIREASRISGTNRFIIHIDCSVIKERAEFENMVSSFFREEFHRERRSTAVLDECTMFDINHIDIFQQFDQIIFMGDPRQLGNVDSSRAIRHFVHMAGGSNLLFEKVYRRIHPVLFHPLNVVAYGGLFELVHEEQDHGEKPVQIMKCRNNTFSIAAAMLSCAIYNASEGRLAYICTQDLNILEYINALISLDVKKISTALPLIKIVPISLIQGIETDTLIMNPQEVDAFVSHIGPALKLAFVVLGRIRKCLCLVQPAKQMDETGGLPLFSFAMHSLLAGASDRESG